MYQYHLSESETGFSVACSQAAEAAMAQSSKQQNITFTRVMTKTHYGQWWQQVKRRGKTAEMLCKSTTLQMKRSEPSNGECVALRGMFCCSSSA